MVKYEKHPKHMPNNKNINLKRYETDVSGLSMNTLEAGLWWAKNKKTLRYLLVTILILTATISWGYTIISYGSYLFFGMNNDNKTINNLITTKSVDNSYLNAKTPKNLLISSPGYINNNDKYDLYVLISNPNQNHSAAFKYCFNSSNTDNSCGNDFLLPGQKKFILALNQNFNSALSNLNFKITDLSWNRINNHIIPNWNTYLADHLNVSIENSIFTPASENASSEKVALNNLTFTATNNSAYGYWSLPVNIILTNGNTVVYTNKYIISDFNSHDSRQIQITWPGTINQISNISIEPNINIIDQGVYKKPQ